MFGKDREEDMRWKEKGGKVRGKEEKEEKIRGRIKK